MLGRSGGMGVLLEGVLSYHVLLVWLESLDGGLVHGIVSLPVGLRQRSSFYGTTFVSDGQDALRLLAESFMYCLHVIHPVEFAVGNVSSGRSVFPLLVCKNF